MKYWLIKSEPDCYSIDDLKNDKSTAWEGVRNYQARNFMKEMEVGDLAIFWHSSTNPPAAVGVAKVVKTAYPDKTQFDPKNEYYEPRATAEKPVWLCPDFSFVEKFKREVPLSEIKRDPKLEGIMVAEPGSRLSVQPVSPEHFSYLRQLGSSK